MEYKCGSNFSRCRKKNNKIIKNIKKTINSKSPATLFLFPHQAGILKVHNIQHYLQCEPVNQAVKNQQLKEI